jgi:hypothetical protein
MEFTLNIECDNAAFGDDSAERGFEIARILRELAERIEASGAGSLSGWTLRDVNGNRVGTAETN